MAVTSQLPQEAETLSDRIDRMHKRDRLGAIAFVLALWVTILFTLWGIWGQITLPALRVILIVSGGSLLIFNTASIVAMLRHYADDREFIYGLDLKHLDEMRRQRRI